MSRVRAALLPAACLLAVGLLLAGVVGPGVALPRHMVVHLALLDLAPVLLLLGLPRRVRDRLPPVGFRGALAGVALATAIVVAVHVPAVFDYGAAHGGAHVVEHLLLAVAGLLLWAPLLLRAELGPAELIAVVTVGRALQSVLGNVLLWAPAPLYAGLGTSTERLHDQRLAAALMMGEGIAASVCLLLWLLHRLLSESAQRRRSFESRLAVVSRPGALEHADGANGKDSTVGPPLIVRRAPFR